MIIGALALAGFPGTSGFFSKDEILVFAAHRGGFYWIFTIGGYIGALLTAFYAFRIVFRVFWGEPVPEARELEQGHLAHAEPENPLSGEQEDTDVGFPGPEHHIAERDRPMWLAMAVLGFLSIFGGALQIPGLDDVIDNFLRRIVPRLAACTSSSRRSPPTGRGWPSAGRSPSIGIAAAYLRLRRPTGHVGCADPALRPDPHASWSTSGTSTSSTTRSIYRPVIAIGRFANDVVERVVVQGIVAAAVDAVRGRRGGRARRPVRLRARLRAAADRRLRRPRPLLPDREQLMAGGGA